MSRGETRENVHDDSAYETLLQPEFKAQTVELIQTGHKSVGDVCRDLDLTETAVRRWLTQAEIDAGRRGGGLTITEREELARLRRENRVLREEREILRKAAAFSPRRRPGEPLSVHRGGKGPTLGRSAVSSAPGGTERLLRLATSSALAACRGQCRFV
ncbi:MAG: transposase [Chloroflexota bacterium]